jgi:hypothetical protein
MNLKGFCRAWGKESFRAGLVGLFCIVAFFTVVSGTYRALRGSSEFREFRDIIQVSVVENKNHYVEIAHLRAYPPFFAIFWAPYGLFPLGQLPEPARPLAGSTLSQKIQIGLSAAFVLLLLTALTVWAARCIMLAGLSRTEPKGACPAGAREPGSEEGGSGWCASALLGVLSGGLMINAIVRCETDMFVVMLVAGAMYLMFVRERQWSSGALLGIAAAFKLTPGLFGVYLLCRRKWGALGGMVAAGFACSVILPAVVWGPEGAYDRTRSWVEKVIVPYSRQGPETFIPEAYRRANQSLRAAVTRYLTRYDVGSDRRVRHVNVADLRPQTVQKIAFGLKAIILGLLLAAWILPSPGREGDLGPVLFALVPTGMLLISDVSVGGHLAILAVPFGTLAAFCFRHAGEPLGRTVSWGVLAGFVAASLIAVQPLKEMSVGTLGIFILYGLGLYVAFRLFRLQRATITSEAG